MKHTCRSAQGGAVLIIALLFLTILTILGVTAMTATTFEEKMAGYARDNAVAFQAAEAALRDARRDLNSIKILPFTAVRDPRISGKTGFGDGTDADNGSCGTSTVVPQTLGLCRPFAYNAATGIPPTFNNTVSLTGSPSVEHGTYTGAGMGSAPGVATTLLSRKPRYFIEAMCLPQQGASLGDPTFCNFYRITAVGWGGNPNTRVIVQEIFLR